MADEVELEFYAKIDQGNSTLNEKITDLFRFWYSSRKEIIIEAGKKLGPTSKMRVREIVSSQGTKYLFCVKTNLKNSVGGGLKTRMEKEHEVMKETFDEFCSSCSDSLTKRIRFTSEPMDIPVKFSSTQEKVIKDVELEYDVYFDKEDNVLPYVKIDIDISHSDLLSEIVSDRNVEFSIDFSGFCLDPSTAFSSNDAEFSDLKDKIWSSYKGETNGH